MAHRGRLNVLAHVVGRPYEVILREFEGERTIEAVVSSEEGGSGDVKYHLGAQGTRSTPTGDITVTLVANPSHLEAVDPVVEGRARAEQTDRSSRQGYHDPTVALPDPHPRRRVVRRPGRASPRRSTSQALAGYSTGGTLHLIANNQVGFTTDPESGRSTRYSSDLAKGFDIPIVHVNADDPEAALALDPARARLPAPLRPRRRRRSRRLPPARPQRAGRGRVHAAAARGRDRGASDRARAVRRAARRRRRRHAGAGGRARRRTS